MKNSWSKTPGSDWSVESAMETLEDLGRQFKRNVDMRVRKGDVRLAVLRLLNEAPMHGYQIIHEIETRSNGAWKPSPGSVYPTLQLLVDEGLIESTESGGRRTYNLTTTGKEFIEPELEKAAPWNTGSDRTPGPRGALATAGLSVAKAAADVARKGSPEQLERAAQLLDETTEALNKILTHN